MVDYSFNALRDITRAPIANPGEAMLQGAQGGNYLYKIGQGRQADELTPAAMAGDRNALAKLAGVDFARASKIDDTAYDRKRQGVADGRAAAADARSAELFKRSTIEWERKTADQKAEDVANVVYNARTPEMFEQAKVLLKARGIDPSQLRFEDRQLYIDQATDLASKIKSGQYTPQSPQGKLEADRRAGVLPPAGAGGPAAIDNETFDNQAKLRDGYVNGSKNYVAIRDAYSGIEAASKDNTGASDIAMVYGFMKMLDPTSVVREGEFATAANAGGIPDRVRAMYNNVINGQRLAPNVRAEFMQQAGRQFESAASRHAAYKKGYEDLATSYGFDPKLITPDLSGGVTAQPYAGSVRAGVAGGGGPPVAATGARPPPPASGVRNGRSINKAPEGNAVRISGDDAEYNALPSGTRFVGPDGVPRRKP